MPSDKRPISEIVKDPKWQKIRESLLGKWKDDPEWCCRQVRSYCSPWSSATNDELRVVMNYLVSSGFRTGRIKHPCISSMRAEVSVEMSKRKVSGKWYK